MQFGKRKVGLPLMCVLRNFAVLSSTLSRRKRPFLTAMLDETEWSARTPPLILHSALKEDMMLTSGGQGRERGEFSGILNTKCRLMAVAHD